MVHSHIVVNFNKALIQSFFDAMIAPNTYKRTKIIKKFHGNVRCGWFDLGRNYI